MNSSQTQPPTASSETRKAQQHKTSRRAALALVILLPLVSFVTAWAIGAEVTFDDTKAQAKQFIEWESSIQLTPEQEAIKKAALEPLPAACCDDNSAYTCCCPCNLSLTIWGLSNHLIANEGLNAEQVRAKVEEWMAHIAPNGFKGDACYTGGCMKSFADGGCGGDEQEPAGLLAATRAAIAQPTEPERQVHSTSWTAWLPCQQLRSAFPGAPHSCRVTP